MGIVKGGLHIMKETELREFYKQRGSSSAQADDAVQAVKELESFAAACGYELPALDVTTLRKYISSLIASGSNTPERLLALARYAYLADLLDAYVYLAGVLGGPEVIASLAERTEALAGAQVRSRVFDAVAVPPLGSEQAEYPAATQTIVQRLQASLPPDLCRRILAGNHHRIPESSHSVLAEKYRQEGLDAVIEYRHQTLLADLEAHAASGKPWYEQIITPEVVEMVRRNPEIQAGVRRGDTIFVAKIPYSPVKYLGTSDPTLKRYYQCHCPLARASIIGEGPRVSPLFCYCSGGYEKLPYDVVFGEPTEVEVLKSALAGDEICRFAIKIPEGKSPA